MYFIWGGACPEQSALCEVEGCPAISRGGWGLPSPNAHFAFREEPAPPVLTFFGGAFVAGPALSRVEGFLFQGRRTSREQRLLGIGRRPAPSPNAFFAFGEEPAPRLLRGGGWGSSFLGIKICLLQSTILNQKSQIPPFVPPSFFSNNEYPPRLEGKKELPPRSRRCTKVLKKFFLVSLRVLSGQKSFTPPAPSASAPSAKPPSPAAPPG